MRGQSVADEIKEKELREPDQGKLDQSDPDVVYMTEDKGPFMCAHCEYFRGPHSCIKVSGMIEPGGCCNLYESVEEDANEVEDDDED